MDEAELRIEGVIVENPLLPGSAHELGSIRSRHECKGRTGFQGAKDADESLGDALVPDEVLGPFVLAELAGAIDVVTTGLLRPVAAMSDQAVGVLGCHGLHEVGSADLQNVIDKVLEFARRRQRQMALEDDPVETGEYGDN